MPQINIWRNSSARISSVSLIIILVVSALTTLGLLVLFSASKAYYANPSLIVQKQFIWLLLSLFSAIVIFRLNLEKLRDFIFILGVFLFSFTKDNISIFGGWSIFAYVMIFLTVII